MYYVNNKMDYEETIAEHIEASLFTYNQYAATIPWKWQIPMEAQNNNERNKRARTAPTPP